MSEHYCLQYLHLMLTVSGNCLIRGFDRGVSLLVVSEWDDYSNCLTVNIGNCFQYTSRLCAGREPTYKALIEIESSTLSHITRSPTSQRTLFRYAVGV